MDSTLFDSVVRHLTDGASRRRAIRAVAGGGLAALVSRPGADKTAAKKKKKKRDRKIGQTCGGQKKCSKNKGPVSCQEFANPECRGVELTGKRCCGLEGSRCDPDFGTPEGLFGNCSCCPELFCGQQPNGELRCQVEDT